MGAESIINFGNQPDLIGTSGVWHRWGPRYVVGLVPAVSGWCLIQQEDLFVFFCWGPFPQKRRFVFFWSCMTRPYNIRGVWLRFEDYESIEACSFCLGMMDMDYWQIYTNLNLPLNFLSFQIFISNMATFTWFYTDTHFIFHSCVSNKSLYIQFVSKTPSGNWALPFLPASPWISGLRDLYQFLCRKQSCLGLFEHGGTNVLMQWVMFYQFSWLGKGAFQGLFEQDMRIYEIFMISWRLAIQLLQQLSTCTQALVPFRYGIWIFLQFWKPFVMCFVALNFESFL